MGDITIQPNDELQKLWIHLSEMVQTARQRGEFDKANEGLRYYLETEKDEGLGAALRLWTGDNFKLDMRFEEAVEAYYQLVNVHAQLTFNGKPEGYHWAAYGLEQIAMCYERMGAADKALGAYDHLFQKFAAGIPATYLYFRQGKLFESMHRDKEAIASYRKAAASQDSFSGAQETAAYAQRQADYLEQPGKLSARPEDISVALARALEGRDTDALLTLASSTHFRIGLAGSELHFVPLAKTLELLVADLKATKRVRLDPYFFDGQGAKLYVATDGWEGKLLQGRVWLLITRLRDGWQWSGLVMSRPGPAWADLFEPVPEQKNQRLEIPIKAPFRRGESWRAGGLARYLTSFAPVVGSFIFFEDNFSGCGYGPGGFYYNDGSTHHGDHAFAIDFTRYVSGLPYFPDQHHREILSVQDGVVTGIIDHFSDHDDSAEGNRVEVEHPGVSDVFAALLRGTPLSPPFKYRSTYMHLAGPRRVPVSVGMFVRQGARLGFSNDTGNSAFSHLHFVLQDRDRGFMSVRPTPMDGQRLEDGDGGKCVSSTNVPFP